MSVTRSYGDIEFECDGCGDGLETHTDEWADAKALLDSEGWLTRKIDGEWKHFCCRTCMEEEFD